MTSDSSSPLGGITPASVAPDDVVETAVRTALSSSNPMVRQRGVEVCETLATAEIEAVRPFLDDVAALAADGNVAVSLRAFAVLDAVSEREPSVLDGRLSAPVDALDSETVGVHLAGATFLGTLVVKRSDLVAPYTRQLIEAVRATEPESDVRNFGDVVDDEVTQRTLQEHEEAERRRLTSARRTLINVVVAIAEREPASSFDLVDDLVALFEDGDPCVVGGAIDALGELAAVDPTAVAPVSDRLRDRLDHDRIVVRARTIRALGHLGDDAAVEKLRIIAETDDDENVRTIAAETAEFLENGSSDGRVGR